MPPGSGAPSDAVSHAFSVKRTSISRTTKEMACILCGTKMFYSEENLVNVCLNEEHGVLCYYELDTCWFAVKQSAALELAKRGLKFHVIPEKIFQNAGLDPSSFKCEYGSK
jgi:hypothetical protein